MKLGCQKAIPTPGQQQWRHIFGAYNWATDEIVSIVSHRRDSDAFIAFIDHLVAQHTTGRPIVIVLDNGSIHHSYATQSAFSLFSDELLPLFLPKYCSQLNPIERYWRHLKQTACANKLFADMDALVASVERTLLEQNEVTSDSRFVFSKNIP